MRSSLRTRPWRQTNRGELMEWFNDRQANLKEFVEKISFPQRTEFKLPDWFWPPFYVFLFSRFVIFLAAYFGEIMIKTGREQEFYHLAPDNLFIDVMARWDSGFYINIVEEGYMLVIGRISNVAFFPLYPLLTSILDQILNNTLLSGIIISHISFLVALIYLYRLTLHISENEETAKRTIIYLSIFPTSFYFSAVYTESLYLCVSVAAVYYARMKNWEIATLFTLLAGVTRITGVLVWGVVGLEWMNSHGWTLLTCYKASAWQNLWRGFKSDWFSFFFLLLAPLGFLSHMLFLDLQFQDPIAFWSVQTAFNRTNAGPIAIFIRDFGPILNQNFWAGAIWWNVLIDSMAVIFALSTVPFVYKRFGEGFSIYILLSILVPLASGTGSMTRYILVLFPIFMLLGIWGKHQLVDRFFQTAFPIFLGILTAVFVNWIFIA